MCACGRVTRCCRCSRFGRVSLQTPPPCRPAPDATQCEALLLRACVARVDASLRYSADGYFYKATVLKALYPGDLEYDLEYQTYAEKAG